MKMIIVVALALVAAAMAAPAVVEKEPVKIISSEHKQESDGNYNFGFKSEDGSERQETGELKEATNEEGKPQRVVVIRGTYSFSDPEGNIQKISYVADENGFRAEGPSIPRVEQTV